ncbi:O-antigen ligase family protein [Mariniflexile jejuense]|uniref:O-antigen ligase family protein n=1 Tax=Mariniflexile jejuense TaxID=1173582 RepID=A0ABW3JJA5_9FLAO
MSAFFSNPTTYNFIRDLLYFSKPLILILVGYFAARKINNWKTIFKIVIYLGVAYAIYHIVNVIVNVNFKTASAAGIRATCGLSNILEIFAIALLFLSYKYPLFNIIKSNKAKNFYLALLLVSFLFYFSRTMFVAIFFLILGALNYLKINKKGLKYGVIILILFGGFYTYLFSKEFDRKGNGLESFLYKMKIAPSEIFSPKLDLKNHAALWDHWRAYEAYCAFEGLNKQPTKYINGYGFGSLVDLKFNAPLSSEGGVQFIPILHNGYVFILYKTGIVGLLLYLVFLFALYFKSYSKQNNIQSQVFSNLIASTALYLLFSSLIISGLYNVEEVTAIVLGVFLYLGTNAKLSSKKS